MKITDPDVIKSGEKDLIDAVKDDLDLDTVKKILEKRMAASTLSPSGGEIIVHNNEIAFRMNFDVQLSGSLMFDRQGNYIPDSDEVDAPPQLSDDASALSPDLDLDIDDMNIEEALEEVTSEAPADIKDNFEDDPDIDEIDIQKEIDPLDEDFDDEELDISLPDYSLDDEEDDIDLDKEDDTSLVDDMITMAEDEQDPLAMNDSEMDDLPAMDDPDEKVSGEESVIDDDINDILKDSRDFWDQKKDS